MGMRLLLAAALLAAAPAGAAELRARSGPARARLIELYSSEGCSSCPPADAWVSSLRAEKGAGTSFVPVIFHVTYWDDLGWPDAFADQAYTARQRAYAASWGTGTVYTPGFVLDGAEWRGWGKAPGPSSEKTGALDARLNGTALRASFTPVADAGPYVVHAARLGFGIESKVPRGENAGRTLRHDFVALATAQAALHDGKAAFVLPAAKTRAPREGFAVWVTGRDGRVIQAAGALPGIN